MPKKASKSPKKKSSTTGIKKYKRARNAYTFFYADVYKKLKRQYPDYGVTDIAKKAGEMWRKLSAEKKAVYEQMAKKDKARAAKEKPQKPKRALTEYQKFQKKHFPALKAKGYSFGETSAKIAAMWKKRGSDKGGKDWDDDDEDEGHKKRRTTKKPVDEDEGHKKKRATKKPVDYDSDEDMGSRKKKRTKKSDEGWESD